MVFGGNGAAANGARGQALASALIDRYASMFRDWGVAESCRDNIKRFRERKSEPLTDDECLRVLPPSRRQWAMEGPAPAVRGSSDLSTKAYLETEVDPVLVPIVRALARDRPRGASEVLSAIARLASAGTTD